MINSNPDFKRLKNALLLNKPDRVPLAELWIDPVIKKQFLQKDLAGLENTHWLAAENLQQAKLEVEFYEKAGYDYIPWSPPFDFGLTTEKSSGEDTPNLEEDYDRDWVSQNADNLNKENFNSYKWPDLTKVNYSFLNEVEEVLPAKMKVIVRIIGILEQIIPLVGWEEFSYFYVEEPDFLKKVIEKVATIQINSLQKAVEYNSVGAIWFADDLAYSNGLFVSPEFLEENLYPYYENMVSICRENDLPLIYHSDGKLWKVMDDIIDIGFDALHPIEPKAMDIYKLKEKYGDKICLIGNLDLGYTLTRGTTEEVKEETKEKIQKLAHDGGYCVGSSNAVSSYVPIENFKAMIEATLNFGNYPI